MITLYSGTPGSGKSLHAARKIQEQLLRKRGVIANSPINEDIVTKNGKKSIGRFTYLRNDKLTVDYLKAYAKQYHKVAVEGQTIVVIDEAGTMFNSREASARDRKEWLDFFAIHRHYGFDIILIAQHHMQLDRQIRYKIEFDVKHKKANNFKSPGLILSLMQIKMFAAVTYWFGEKERIGAEIFKFRKQDALLYKTMMLFDDDEQEEPNVQLAQTKDEKTADQGADEERVGGSNSKIPELETKTVVQTAQNGISGNSGISTLRTYMDLLKKSSKSDPETAPGSIEQKQAAPQDVVPHVLKKASIFSGWHNYVAT
jgi:hypothetical protein